MSKLTVLDLFSGIGGFSLGLERTGGFKTVAFCEINNYCQRVLRKHWPDTYIHSDIRTLGEQHFEHYRKPDVIVGGFPCQDISVAGKQVGLNGERSGLWFEMLRVIRELRPTWLLIENVPNLRTKGADIVFAGLEEADYAWTSAVVGAQHVGLPHNRNRVWILAHSERERLPGRIENARLSSATQTAHSEHGNDGFGEWRELAANLAALPHDDGVPLSVVRSRIKPLGNSVVPKIPELFGRFILSMEAA